MRLHLASLLLALALAVPGCGQKGELYLREAPPAGVKPAKPEAYKPVPYPREPADDADGAKKRP